jgi:mannosyltransferase OCH1-like enzyme
MPALFKHILIRLMQLTGNLLKLVFYMHLKLLPKARFQIPACTAPLWPRQAKKISATLWLTNYTDRVTLAVYVNYLWNRLLAARCEVRLCLDAECESFIATHFPGRMAQAYSRLQIGAAKADFWRVLVLLQHGGVYIDMDAALCWPVSRLLSKDPAEILARYADGRLTNYFLAFAPGHPLMQDIAEQITRNIEANTLTSVYDMTGPTVFEQLADRPHYNIQATHMLARQGMFTSKKLQYPDAKKHWIEEQKEKKIVG